MTSQPINNGPLAFQLNSSGLSTMGNCQVLQPVNDGYNPLNDVNIELVNTIYYWSGHAPAVQYSTPNELSRPYRQFSTIRRTSGERTTSGDCQLHFHGLSPYI